MRGGLFLYYAPLLYLLYIPGAVAQTRISIIPQEISLSVPSSSSPATSQTVTVVTAGQNLPFTAAVRYLSPEGGWLSLTPVTGTTPATLTVTADGSRVSPGTHLGQITVTAGGIGAAANILFTVGSGSGTLVAQPTGLTFFGQSGTPELPSQIISVASRAGSGDTTFRVVASSSGDWLNVPPGTYRTPANLTVNVTQSGLAAGIYNGSITLIPDNGGTPTAIPVVLVAAGSQTTVNTFTLKQTAVTITQQVGASAPSVQSVGISASGGFAQYTASVTSPQLTPWLKVTSTFNPAPSNSVTDFTPGEFSIQVDPNNLPPPGTYTGTVDVSAPGITTQQLTVTLIVTNTPAVNANPSSVVLDETTTAAPVIVTSTGSSDLAFTAAATSAGGWLNVTPTAGSTANGAQLLAVSANIAGLAPGTYLGTITLTPQGAPVVTIPVRLTVSVQAATAGNLVVLTDAVSFNTLLGNPDSAQIVSVDTDNGIAQKFTAAANSTGGWLRVEPFMATTPIRLNVTASPAAVGGAGTYNGSILLTSLATGLQTTLPVSLVVTAQGIAADPASLTFTQTQKDMAPAAQKIQVTSNTPSTFIVTDVPVWLKVDPRVGAAPATLNVWPDLSLLPPGSNLATIKIVGPNNEIAIPVSVTLAEPASPTASPQAVAFTYKLGDPDPAAQTLSVGSTGEQISFTAIAATDTGVKWFSVTPTSGTTPANLTVTIDPKLLVPGKQTGAITLASTSGSPKTTTIPVTVDVTLANVVVQGVLNQASRAPTAVAPGQIVTITGTGLGPVTGVTARPTAAGAVETSLADTRVLFDGVAAPVLFVQFDQVNAVAPYTLYGRVSTRVQVQQGSTFSVPIEVKVVDTAPGILTQGGTGRGQASALNSDATLNSVLNPAQRGTIITVFGTGEGQTDPPGQDGRIILTDLRHPIASVSAKIGGRPAEVAYIGSASGLVSGVFQANIRIPADIEPGTVPIEIQVGGTTTQTGVTVVVR